MTSGSAAPDPTRVARDLLRRSLLTRAVEALGSAEIPVMPLKGALFAYWLYADPSERLGRDVDLLVRERDFDRAVRRLADVGFVPEPPHLNGHERVLCDPRVALEVDLHRALFAPGRYDLPTADLFARGRVNAEVFGVPVVIPDAYDAYAHVVGHAAAERVPPIAAHTRRDLVLLAARPEMDAARCARHLHRVGLARAARYTLGSVASSDPFASDVLRHLPPDPLGTVLARVTARITARKPGGLASRIAGHLTNRSIGGALRALAIAIAGRVRRRLASAGPAFPNRS